ncbi:MAG: TonB-dependent receptor [Anaeromyxobacteraceae bacterium]|nr:TonB-dependent receptor [Anaeromyxobacteraceae bacterium]
MKKLLQLASLALLFTGVASAQTTGSITGVVTDGATGKPVVGAVVVATSPAAPGEQTAVTDAKGAFTIANLPAGKYALQATVEGYKPESRFDLVLAENVTLRANLAVVPDAVQLEEVVVTGSRIRRKDLTTAAPVSVVNKEQVAASGKVSIGEYLNTMPEAVAALGRGNNNGGDGTVRIALRGLGDARTLVLVNGRRWVAGGSGADASVDLNTLPTSAIERIEVLKDGASAVYGSDAIGGVVNVITRKAFTGSEFTAYSGTSGQGDGTTYDVSGTFGTSNEKGSILFSASFTRQDPVWAGDRSWSKNALAADYSTNPIDVFTLGSGTIPAGRFRVDTANCAAGTTGDLCRTLAAAFPGSSFFTYDPAATATGGYRPYAGASDSYNFAPFNYLYTPSQRYNFFTSGEYKLNEYAKAYFEGSFMNRRTDQKLAPVPLVADQFNPPGIISAFSQYNEFGQDILVARSRLVNLSNRTFSQDTDTVRVVTGFGGNITPDWNWDVSYTYGRTSGTDTMSNVVRTDLVAAALGPSRNGVCYSDTTYTTPIPGCIPLDLLHGPAPADQIAGIAFAGPDRGYNTQTIWAGSVSGELITLKADRPVGVAAGVEYRTENGAYIVNPFAVAGLSSDSNSGSTQGGYSVTEAFAELSIPVINNAPFVYELEGSLAARYSDYSTFGSNTTWKAGLRYSPIRDVTVRGTYSTAFRAPSINELYSGTAESFPDASDPCAGPGIDPASPLGQQCGAAVNNGDLSTQLKSTVGGNASLEAETANIFTVGVVIEPRWVENLAVTLDYYDTTVKKTVDTLGVGTILNGCYLGGNDAYCSKVTRSATTGYILNINDTNTNVGELRTSGIDLAVRYALSAGKFGRFGFGAGGTVLLKDDWLRPDGTIVHAKGTYDYGYADPTFKGAANVTWGMGGLSAGLDARYLGGFKECGDATGSSGQANLCADTPQTYHMVSDYWAFNANVGYALSSSQGKTALVVGILNLADQAPPKNYNAFANSADTAYDYMGRFFYARLNHSF